MKNNKDENRGVRILVGCIVMGWMLCVATLQAQISHGGNPLPLSMLRSDRSGWTEEMPPFDVAAEMRIDSLNESDLRSGHRFAYKFMTRFTPDNSGVRFTLPDGTNVWRLGIRSAGAYSINLLFTRYHLPEGAQLFLYDPAQRQVLGSFDHRNNSDLDLLPTAPVWGDELIVEYQEPAKAAFRGELEVGEVNHAYRQLRGGAEPKEDVDWLDCIPAVSCYADSVGSYDPVSRSVVMLIIDGSVSCTGVLMNNRQQDGRPYVMTASHCLNENFTVENPDYAKIAGSIVSFFNYESPLCRPKIRGTEEMSMASARLRAVNERHDMVLLELLERPPLHYRPYYAGWNLQEESNPPYTCLQHPKGGTKGIAIEKEAVPTVSFDYRSLFEKESHLYISAWEVGCTALGSSGAPLLDASHRVVGILSGGRSSCQQPNDDYFYSLRKAWRASDDPAHQLAYWLDPLAQPSVSCPGLNPYAEAPCLRLSHVQSSGHRDKVEQLMLKENEKEPLFGNNSLGVTACVEAYECQGTAELYGLYLVTPAVSVSPSDLKVNVVVYEGEQQPERLLCRQPFRPAYRNKSSLDQSFQETVKSLNRAQESYVQFDKPIEVKGRFFVGYEIEEAPKGCHFSAYNLPKGVTTRNTTYLQQGGQWLAANEHASALFNTSLYIDPLLCYTSPSATEPIVQQEVLLIRQADGRVWVQLPQEVTTATYSIHTITGQTWAKGSLCAPQAELPVHSCPAGVYVVCICYNNKYFARKMIF